MIFHKSDKIDFKNNIAINLAQKMFKVTPEYHDQNFFVRKDGVLWATPLFVVLFLVEFSDVVFAVDSIPAILAVTTDPFVVYTSNIFAILGLRASYFALAASCFPLSQLWTLVHLGIRGSENGHFGSL